MSAFLNISSLSLGLLSWFLPLLSLKRRRIRLLTSSVSYFCCALSLLLQLAEIDHRIGIGDLAGVIDTIYPVTLAGTAMLVICVTINLVVFLRRKK